MISVLKDYNDLVYQLDISVNKNNYNIWNDCNCKSKMKAARVSNFYYFEVTFYTDDIGKGIICSYDNGVYDNIIPDDDQNTDFAIINLEDLKTLNNGLLKYKIYFKMLSDKFSDGFFDYSEFNNTNIYLTDNNNCNDNGWCSKI